MSEGEDDSAKTAGAPRRRPSSGSGGFRRPAKVHLLGSLRGAGTLAWSAGAPVAVTYEIDIFGAGDIRSISGAAEGDFRSAPEAAEGDEDARLPARLTLADGHELAIEVTERDSGLVQFEGQLTATAASRLSH